MAHKKVIAVDVDDVLSMNAAHFIAFSNAHWGSDLTPDDFQENFSKMWGVSNEEVNRRMHEYTELGIPSKHTHFEEAVPILAKLAERYMLTIVTSRRKHLQQITADWLLERFGDIFEGGVHHAGFFDDLKEASYHQTKADLCQKVGAHYLIDDQLKHCLAALDVGVKPLLFGDYSWNQTDSLPQGVTRVKDWLNVQEYFDAQS